VNLAKLNIHLAGLPGTGAVLRITIQAFQGRLEAIEPTGGLGRSLTSSPDKSVIQVLYCEPLEDHTIRHLSSPSPCLPRMESNAS
jgi:hypothetical protein